MGEAASERAATEVEVAAMRTLVAEAMEAGAIGFASSHSQNHNGYGGVPMPSRLADDSELRALVGVLGEAGKGLVQITVGPQATEIGRASGTERGGQYELISVVVVYLKKILYTYKHTVTENN